MTRAAMAPRPPGSLAPIDHLTSKDFALLAEFIEGYSGIKMPQTKKTMVEGRLRHRVRATGHADLAAYCRHLFADGGLDGEAVHLIDAVTTNKTEFFREPDHFRFLAQQALPTLLAKSRGNGTKPLKLWSAACSIGAEPYSLAMLLADVALSRPTFRAIVTATDLSTRVLETGYTGIYSTEDISPVPADMRQRYLLRARDPARDQVRIVPELRAMVQFGRVNLTKPPYPVDGDMDVIFCRNILIYFDKPTQAAVLEQLCQHLVPGGYLFIGHSEALTGLNLPVEPVATTVFRRLGAAHA